MSKAILFMWLCLWAILPIMAQTPKEQMLTIEGTVMDQKNGETLIGVTVYVKNEPGVGTATDINGKFKIKAPKNATLVFSYVGYADKEVFVGKNENNLKVRLSESVQNLDEVLVTTANGQQQRKVSIVGAISTIDPKVLDVPATSISNMLGGRVPGIIALNRSGEPGADNAEFWVRGISTFGASSGALILIDGIEGAIDDVDPADIESFSVLKDASSTAVYGARGANGVVLITTKKGEAGKLSINVKSSVTLSQPGRMPDYVGAYDYATLANEARIVRGFESLYDETEMKIIRDQLDPDLYPDVDWRDELMKKITWNHQHYISARGGGAVARYFLSVGMQSKNDNFKKNEGYKYKTNIGFDRYTWRANIEANLTKTTILGLNVDGVIKNTTSPGYSKNNNQAIWDAQASMTPLTVPVKYSNGYLPSYGTDGYSISPVVLLNEFGYSKKHETTIKNNLSLKQDLGFITKGLRAELLGSFKQYTMQRLYRRKTPDLYHAIGRNAGGELLFEHPIKSSNLTFSDEQSQNRTYYLEAKMMYSNIFAEKHRLGALIHYYMQDYQFANEEVKTINNSIPKRNQALSGQLTYSYNDIYFVEGNFGYTGSENFRRGEQFGFFPGIGVSWLPSEYQWFRNSLPWFDKLKFRGSWGQVGNDRITDKRFPFLTTVNENCDVVWGKSEGKGFKEDQVGADNLRWEAATKWNLGIDVTLLKNTIDFTIDFYKDVRKDIFQQRELLPSEVGEVNKPYVNVGSMTSKGIDGNISFSHRFTKDLNATIRGNFTYAVNEIDHYDQQILDYPYQDKNGKPYNIRRGLISLGLFRDSTDIMTSPTQTFGEVRPGDIKYKDVNGDGVINDLDEVPISYSSIPQIQYGFAADVNYKNWNFSIFFTGISKVNVLMGGAGFFPFQGQRTGNVLDIVNNQKNRWTPAWFSGDPSTENPDARFPRLTYGESKNNSQASTFWMENGRFLRLKTIQVGYTLNSLLLKKYGVQSVQFQLIGDNIAVWDKIKLWDPEQSSDDRKNNKPSNGAVYPLQRSFTLQVNINF